MNKEKLRIGLLLDDYSVPHWVYGMIEKINSSQHSEITLVVKEKKVVQPKLSFLKKVWVKRKQLFYKLYTKLDNTFLKTAPDAFAPKNILDILDCTLLELGSPTVQGSHLTHEKGIEKIKANAIDVLVSMGLQTPNSEILSCAKYGLWSYHHADILTNRGKSSGVWEVFENWRVTGVTLQLTTLNPDDDKVLYKSYSRTDDLSVNRTKNECYWLASSFIPRKLNQLYELGGEKFFDWVDRANADPSFYSNRLYNIPTNLETIKKVSVLFFASLKRKINRIFYFKQWILLYKLEDSKKMARSFYQFKRMMPPKDTIWADPFVISKNDKYFIFLEEMSIKENKGKISLIEMDEQGNYGGPQVVIENDYHMSYPLLLEEQGQLYMVPETGANRTIEIYRCTEFPLKWELEKVLINNIRAADATIFKYHNKYWMFTNVREVEGASVHGELFLFHSDGLLQGDWSPHPQNPIVSDVRCARSAGNIFVHNGRLFRPAQNGSKEYGYGMQIREIVTLTEEVYEERQVQSIHPNWSKDLIGTHTLNSHGRLTVIDGLIRRRR